MRGTGCIGAVTAALALAFVPATAGAGTVDQEQMSSTPDQAVVLADDHALAAQSFTAGRTGGLDQVDLVLSHAYAYRPLRVAIRRVGGDGRPSDELGVTEISPAGEAHQATVRTASFDPPVYVQAGRRYAIVAGSTDSDYRHPWFWLAASGDPYPSGGAFQRFSQTGLDGSFEPLPGLDLMFRTYVGPGPDCIVMRAVINDRVVCT